MRSILKNIWSSLSKLSGKRHYKRFIKDTSVDNWELSMQEAKLELEAELVELEQKKEKIQRIRRKMVMGIPLTDEDLKFLGLVSFKKENPS
nr:hypothetical protein [Allomuricauda sp.]